MAYMDHPESGRRYLSPDILHVADNIGIRHQEMQPGQNLRIHAQDATTGEQSYFDVTVLSVRDVEGRSNKTATLQYRGGTFNFYDGEDFTITNRTAQLEPGTLMENGISATLIPQTDYRLVYLDGIGLGRDHSFEFVGGENRSVIAHRVERIEIGTSPSDFQAPDISDHLKKIEKTRQRKREDKEKVAEEVNEVVMNDLEEHFGDHPAYQQIRKLITGYSPNGKLVMSSFLIYAKEDGVLDKAWEVLQRADERHFSFEHPSIRGDSDIKASSRTVFEEMLRDAGIQWPRPKTSKFAH